MQLMKHLDKAVYSGRLFVCGIVLVLVALVAGCSTAGSLPEAATPIMPPAKSIQPTAALAQPTALPNATPSPTDEISGTIMGQLLNGTLDGPIPTGLTMTLYALAPSMDTVIFTRTAQADAAGQARFEGLDATPGTLYAIVAEYQNVFYYNDPQHFAPDQATLKLPVTVYEATSDPDGIRVDRLHVILDVQPGSIQVGELLVLSNTGDRALMSSDGTSLHWKVPGDASGLRFEDGEMGGRYLPTADGFADTEAVLPGERTHQILFSFVLPYNGDSLDLTLPLAYPVQNVNVLLPDVGVRLASEQLTPVGSMPTEGGAYLNFGGAGPLSSGESLSFRLTGAVTLDRPPGQAGAGAGAATGASSTPLWLIVGIALGTLAIIAGVFMWWRSRQVEEGFEEDEDDELPDQETLLDEIAALDDAYEAGQIAESDYRREREELKAELAELLSGE